MPDGKRRRARWWARGGLLIALAAALIMVFGAGGRQSQALRIERSPKVRVPSALPPDPVVHYDVSLPQAASNAARELAGSGDNSVVGWIANRGAWGLRDVPPGGKTPTWHSPWWWQSALDLRAMVRYLEQTRNTDPGYEHIIEQTYQMNVAKPESSHPVNFGNQYMDDTAWWGLAWVETARYELNVRHDSGEATRFLKLAEWDANYIWTSPRRCNGGIEWLRGTPPDTITNAEFASLVAELAQAREQPGAWHNAVAAGKWVGEARQSLWWLHASHLINLRRGHVYDRYDSSCRITGGSLPYTEGETADALIQQGLATGKRSLFTDAQRFLNYALARKTGLLDHGVLQERCEAQSTRCLDSKRVYDATAWKSILVDAVADYRSATGSRAYDWFLTKQAQAMLSNASSNGEQLTPCHSPHDCQLGFYWARRLAPSATGLQVGPGSQEAGLSVLTDALSMSSPPPNTALG